MNESQHYFVPLRNTRESAALCQLALVIPRRRTNEFNRLFYTVAVRLWNLLPPGMFSDDTLSFFKSAMNLWLQGALLDFTLYLFQSLFARL